MKKRTKTRPFKTGKDGHSWTDILSFRTDKSKKSFRKLKDKVYKLMKSSEKQKEKNEIRKAFD